MSKRGMRRTSMRVRLAVAAALLAGGGAAGVVALSASHDGAAAAASAGFTHSTGRTMGYTDAISSAMNGWSKSSSTSLMTLSHMKPVRNTWTQSWHHHTLVVQRGRVVGVAGGEFAVLSANGTVKVWHVNRKTHIVNVGGTMTGMSAMTGGTMNIPASWNMNTRVQRLAFGDRVFVFGEREGHTLKAQLVLFVAPMTTTPTATPTVTTPVGTPTATVMPTGTPTTTAPVVKPTSTAPSFSGHNS